MIRGLHISKTGMITQQRKQENIANNIVNSNTTGFKKASSAIAADKDLFLHRLNDEILRTSFGNTDKKPAVGPLGMGVFLDETLTNFLQGNMIETNIKSDLAIAGNGFFTVEQGGQLFLTRDGSFNIDSQGNLVNGDGLYLHGSNGRITLPQGHNGQFSVSTNGQISVGDQFIDTIRITTIQNPHSLDKLGNNLFATTARTTEGGVQGEIIQGYLEGSNVDLADEMVELIATMRAYEANQRAIHAHDETLGKAVNEIASVR
ncbi:flagellar hook-basal body protein [Alkalicella caledoniensis]|uniref:Flagellar hook-basal body protein n=1 Tax=Alkalicella caledoniensis TaxID=2731377 RepID=A0A7G9W920_ALKCA|nr:flagellar hook-basal body protein [Alkalicella caledoniensis]QNO15182.1 flagellar hook-basal body protein [Alkalicella caledoniensis]